MQRGDARHRAQGRCQKGRRARHRPHRRHHGGQAHARTDPALPSAADHPGRGRSRARREAARHPGRGAGSRSPGRPASRWKRSPPCRRLPHDLRHGEGGRTRHAHRGHPADREARRPAAAIIGRRSRAVALLSVAEALERVLANAAPLPAEDVPLADASRPRPGLRSQGVAHPAAGGRFRHGRLRGARRRCRQRAGAPENHRRSCRRPAVRRHGRITGEAARIFTGGVVPAGADTVVIQELTSARRR